jgi:2-succinyl-6-hydroxy-2,4-cyclohexadiene-1-carboxylate synthase
MTTPVVVLHGFAGHADSWQSVRAALPERDVLALTLFGHDPTQRPAGTIAFEDEVARVAERLRAFGQPVRLCGYSMGGRITLGLLARFPELVESAILVGAHPGLTTDEERQQRVTADEVWVRVLEDEGIESFTSKWQAQPLFATQAKLDEERLARQRAIRLHHDPRSLALSMASLGLGRMPSYWEALERSKVTVDLVVGALDEKFAGLAARMFARMPSGRGRVLRVEGAGHNVLLERPELLAHVIGAPREAPLAPGLLT